MKQSLAATIADPRFRIARGAVAAQSAAKMPFVLTLIVVGLFIPEELSFYVLGLRLTVIRLIFLLLAPVLLARWIQKVSAGRYRFVLSDLFVVLTGFWLIYAPANVDGLIPALNHAGPDVLEFCIGYMTTRLLLCERGHALSFIDVLCRAIAVVALVGTLDTFVDHRFAHDLAAQLGTPMHNIDTWEDRYRMGLFRATGPIEHPILYGFVCAIGLLLAVSIPIRGRGFVIFSCSVGAILALSSAPIQIMLVGFCLLAYERMLSKVPFRWLALIIAGLVAIMAAFVASDSPVGFIISNFTFSPQSGYYRVWTWQTVGLYVSQSPWVGLGYGEMPEELNHSIDSLWLVFSLRSGIPCAVLVALSLFSAGAILTKGNKSGLTPAEAKLAAALGILLFLTAYISFTVHLWGTIWILTGLLIGTKAHLTELGSLPDAARQRLS
jgi:hypothetical protein